MLLGYVFTAAIFASLALFLAFLFFERKGLKKLFGERVNSYSIIALVAILAFFVVFSLLFVSPAEQLYFDENIYQGIAINMLKNGNGLWCQFGTGYLETCYINSLYHDPVGWSAFIAIAFAIFGIGTATAYNLELLSGAMSILLVFLLASLLSKKKSYAVISTFAFALMPILFVWARTQADVDLPFMMLAELAFLTFIIFIKRKTLNSLALFAFSLVLVSYMRIEAILLVGVFAILLMTFGEKGVKITVKERRKMIISTIENNTKALLLFLVFVFLILPQIYYIAVQAQNPSYGQGSGQSVISITNFLNNIKTNVLFVFGQISGKSFYPMVFSYTILPLAILGTAFLIFDGRIKNRFGIMLMLLLWFLAYFMFYTSFYAGAASFGVDSRFMLQLLPSSVLLASFAIVETGDAVQFLFARKFKHASRKNMIYALVVIALASALLAYPFIQLAPVITLTPTQMPQQSDIIKAINFFYDNYNAVPQNCLVYSFTPDIWAEVNRTSAQIDYINGGVGNATIRQAISEYSCQVLDYGYWCLVPPYRGTLCKRLLSSLELKSLAQATEPVASGGIGAFYQILNKT